MPFRQLLNVAYNALAEHLDDAGLAKLDAQLVADPTGKSGPVRVRSRGTEQLMALMGGKKKARSG